MTKSFTQFLRSGKTGLDIESTRFLERLIAADIETRAALLRYVRERYPDNYFRKLAERLWANYLAWKE